MLNQLTAIKYQSWDSNERFRTTALRMWQQGGWRPFAKGISATVTRDAIFGGVYSTSKFVLNSAFDHLAADEKHNKWTSAAAGVVAASMVRSCISPLPLSLPHQTHPLIQRV